MNERERMIYGLWLLVQMREADLDEDVRRLLESRIKARIKSIRALAAA